jgi:hypothetical protein
MTKLERIELLRGLKQLKGKNIPPEYLTEFIRTLAAVFESNTRLNLYYDMLEAAGIPFAKTSMNEWQETIDRTLDGKSHSKYNPKKYSY